MLARSRYIVGWLDGHDWLWFPEQAARRPNAKPVFQFNAAIARKEST